MAVHFDHRLETNGAGINTEVGWFKSNPLLAVLAYSEDRGGSVLLYNEEASGVQHRNKKYILRFNKDHI